MKISELIGMLKQMRKEHGDLPVYLRNNCHCGPSAFMGWDCVVVGANREYDECQNCIRERFLLVWE